MALDALIERLGRGDDRVLAQLPERGVRCQAVHERPVGELDPIGLEAIPRRPDRQCQFGAVGAVDPRDVEVGLDDLTLLGARSEALGEEFLEERLGLGARLEPNGQRGRLSRSPGP